MLQKSENGQETIAEKKNREQSPLKIGELLVKDNYLRVADIERVLEIQKKDAEFSDRPLGEILVKKKNLTKQQLKSLLNHPSQQKLAGNMAVATGLITNEQLNICLKKVKNQEILGETLIRKGYLNQAQLDALLYQLIGSRNIGELALKLDMITKGELKAALEIKRSKRTIGAILCDLNLITSADLTHILQKYKKQTRFGEILVDQGYITQAQADAALSEHAKTDMPLGEVLKKRRLIDEDELYTALSKQYNIPYRKIDEFNLNDKSIRPLISIVGQRYAETNLILPLFMEGNLLTLAISDPNKAKASQELKTVYPHLGMNCVLITHQKFEELFKFLYGESLEDSKASNVAISQPAAMDRFKINLSDDTDEKDGIAAKYAMSSMEVEQVVNYIIKYGITNNASDIHIEQDRSGSKIRFRIDGMLKRLREKSFDEKLNEMTNAIISRIKVVSNLDIAERRAPQDGVFRVSYFDKEKNCDVDLDFRVATCPAIVGENMTIRILDSRKARVGLENLNHSRQVLEPFMRMLKSSSGTVLVSGPTGSGKSSTLYSALQYIYNPSIKIITAEDPIEYSFPGIMQTQVNQKKGLNFAKLLRSFLRLDPDVILVGEIRDEETASIGFDAAQTGHLLLSTIHTNDAVAAISRLSDLNIDRSQMASSLLGVLSQRLCRQICYNCMVPYQPDEYEWRIVFDSYPKHLSFYKGEGCDICGFTGYKGRILISELFEVTQELSLALSQGATEREIKQLAIAGGMKTMVEDGIQKMHQTTLSEVIRVVPSEMIKVYKARNQASVNGNDCLAIESNSVV